MFTFILLPKKRDKKASIKNSFFKVPQITFYTDKPLVKVHSKKQTPLISQNQSTQKGGVVR